MIHSDETPITYLIDGEELLRLEKALRGAQEHAGRQHVPPSVIRDIEEALRLAENIRGR